MKELKNVRFPRFVTIMDEGVLVPIFCLFVGAGAIVGGGVWLSESHSRPSIFWPALLSVGGLIWTSFLAIMSRNSRRLEPVTLILSRQGADWQVLMTINQTLVVWEKDLERFLAENFAVIDDPSIKCQVEMETRPITANPKVRELTYSVVIRAVGDLRGAKARLNLRNKWQNFSFEKWLRFQLYEFQEKRSVQLAEFYNPVSHEQQADFLSLVMTFLHAELDRAGFELMEARFSC